MLRLMAFGIERDEIPHLVAPPWRGLRPFSSDDFQRVLVDATAAVRDKRLLPPARAGFIQRFRSVLIRAAHAKETPPVNGHQARRAWFRKRQVSLSEADIDGLRIQSQRLLEAYLADDRDSPDFPRPRQVGRHCVALTYAEALVHQEEIIEAQESVSADDAPLQAALTGTDLGRVNDLLLYLGSFWTLDSSVDTWRRMVRALERHPASLLYEEYENWLDSRDRLEAALSQVFPMARAGLESRVRPLDERFISATREVTASIKHQSPWKPQPWWWYRVPSQINDAFQDRLEHEKGRIS